MNYIFLLLFFELVLFLAAFLLNNRDIMAPSVMMCTMFIISTGFAIANIQNWSIQFGLNTCIILSSGILVYLLAETVFRFFFENSKMRRYHASIQMGRKMRTAAPAEYVQKWMIWAVIGFDVIVLFLYFLGIRRITGFSGFNSLIFSTYRSMIVHLESRSNSNVEQMGTIINQLLKFVRAFGFAAEYIMIKNMVGKKKFRQYTGLFVIVILAALAGLIVASRAVILQLIAAGLIEYSIVWHQKYGWGRNLSWKIFRIGVISLLIGIPAFHFTAQMIGESTRWNAFKYASVYLGSSIQLFDMFVQNPVKTTVFGEETLVGIRQFLDQLGISTFTRDINLEFHTLEKGMRSNVYTFFRRPMHDFGFGGMLVFTILVALLFTWLYYGKIKQKSPSVKLDSWVLIYGYAYYWIFLSSIDQGSQLYISFNALSTIIMIIIAYRLMTGVKIFARNRGLVITRRRRMFEN